MNHAPRVTSLAELARQETACRRCSLYQNATTVVPGNGARHARLMLVGEQPGDHEDRAGKPFVGPAGKMLDRALEEAGIARETIFVTNAVKHFKFEWRGKRRLHARPNTSEIEACRWWLDHERSLIRPVVILAMGGTAAKSVFGRAVTIATTRGVTHALTDGTRVRVTIHPSFVLRLRAAADSAVAYARFVADVRAAADLARRD